MIKYLGEEGGRNGVDEHQDYKAKYKGSGSPKPQQTRKTTPSHLSNLVEHNFCIFGYRSAGEGVHCMQRTKLKTSFFSGVFFF
jgi:hypothetical protein